MTLYLLGPLLVLAAAPATGATSPSDHPRWNPRIPSIGSKNVLPNSSFELGSDGWSSLGAKTGWGGDLCGLYGEVVEGEAWEGNHSLRIELGPGKTRTTYYDVWPAARKVQSAPLAANLGWVDAIPGEDYTLSVYMKADRPGVKAKLMFRYGPDPVGGRTPTAESKAVTLSKQWARYAFTAPAAERDMCIAAGPDLSGTPDASATVWIDAVQLEQASSETPYARREQVEVGFDAGKFGNVFTMGETALLHVYGANATASPVKITLQRSIQDYFDSTIAFDKLDIRVPAGETALHDWPLTTKEPGFYRVNLSWDLGGVRHSRSLRFAIIPAHSSRDSLFGINHAPTTPELCQLLVKAGITWARDWSLVWGNLEPVEGQLSFAESDQHIARVQEQGMHVLGLFPLPSTNWGSLAPAEVQANRWSRMSYMPADKSLLMGFMEQAISRYRSGVRIWEFLNEPLWTEFCLPAAEYAPDDYIALLKQAYPVMKAADPTCKVIGGFSAEPWRYSSAFVSSGGLSYIDIYNLHNYGVFTAPEEFIGHMQSLLSLMDRSGGRKPIWMTEYSYYAADDKPWSPWVAPPGHWSANLQLKNERQCADWTVRYSVIMLAHGVEKLFYHQGAEGEVNNGSWNLECALIGEEGMPRKLYAAQAALANLLGAKPVYTSPMERPSTVDSGSPSGIYGYSFQCGKRAIMAVWVSEAEAASCDWRLALPTGVVAYNIVGNRLSERRIGLDQSPVYLASTSLNARQLAGACTLEKAPSSSSAAAVAGQKRPELPGGPTRGPGRSVDAK